MSAVTPETDVIRKHRKEEIRDEEFKEQEIRIPGSSCPGSHYHGRDNAPDLICGQREKAQCKQAG